MADLDVVTRGGVLIDDEGRIAEVADADKLRKEHPDARIEEVSGVLFPGFVDSHTHGVFGPPRTADQARRAKGIEYKTIAEQGGGILSSVRDVRALSEEDLLALTRSRMKRLLGLGTTTVEVKSGYGLSLEDEIKQLRVIRKLGDQGPTLVPTFLGAHEVPAEHRDDPEAYVDLVVNEMLPAVVQEKLAVFCDVFCEPGVFTPKQSERVLSEARKLGLDLKIHADELDGSGGAELAVSLNARSADHLAAISDKGVGALARAPRTVAVLLPGTQLFLGRTNRAPARSLIDEGASVALATDFNPGSSPGMSLPLMAMLGVSQLKMAPEEAVIAVTVNAAAAIGVADRVGQLAPGFDADMVEADIGDWREMPYWYGANMVRRVWKRGAPCP